MCSRLSLIYVFFTSVDVGNDLENIRLVSGLSNSSGRIEVFFNREWGTVSNDSSTMVDAYVVCRQFGHPAAVVIYTNLFLGEGSGIVWIKKVRSRERESKILKYKHERFGQPECNHGQLNILFSESYVKIF